MELTYTPLAPHSYIETTVAIPDSIRLSDGDIETIRAFGSIATRLANESGGSGGIDPAVEFFDGLWRIARDLLEQLPEAPHE